MVDYFVPPIVNYMVENVVKVHMSSVTFIDILVLKNMYYDLSLIEMPYFDYTTGQAYFLLDEIPDSGPFDPQQY